MRESADLLATQGEASLRAGRVDEGVALLERAWSVVARGEPAATADDQASILETLAIGATLQGYPGRAARWRALRDAIRSGRSVADAVGTPGGVAQGGDEVWATRAFATGDTVGTLPEEPVVSAPTRWTIQVGPEQHLVIDGPFAYLEHSCRPNTRVDTAARTVVALRPIAPGERLTFFYPATEWAMAEAFSCHCGQPGCLGAIRGARYLPVEEVLARGPAPHILAALAGSPEAPT
jgi:hypothetical protein